MERRSDEDGSIVLVGEGETSKFYYSQDFDVPSAADEGHPVESLVSSHVAMEKATKARNLNSFERPVLHAREAERIQRLRGGDCPGDGNPSGVETGAEDDEEETENTFRH